MGSPAQRALAAEARAVEEGHRAFVQEGGWVRVASDSRPGKHYRVDVAAGSVGALIAFSCHPEGAGAYSDDHLALSGLGYPPCKHAAVAARRLEREGLAAWDAGAWLATDKAAVSEPADEDPFACFSG